MTIPLMADLSALTPEGGLPALGVTATSFCARTCSAPSQPLCVEQTDCTGGATCTGLPEGSPILIVLGAETLGVCATSEGGVAGTADGAAEGAGGSSSSDAPSGE